MKKWIFITMCFGVILGLIYYLFRPIDSVINQDYTINLKNGNIYVRTIIWGVAGGHDAIVFSSNPISSNDIFGKYDPVDQKYKYKNEKEILVYYQPEIYYKKQEDTLFIYSISKMNGKLFENAGLLTIIPVESKVNEWYNYKNNYKKYGLVKIETKLSK